MKTFWTSMVAIALLLSTPLARADNGKWVSAPLPLGGDVERASVAITPGQSGSVFVIACIDKQLVALEWALSTRTLVRKKVLGNVSFELGAVVAERSGSDLFVLAASRYESDNSDEVVLFTLDESLALRSREVIGYGILPSVAANDRYLVTAFHERRTPSSPHPRTPNGPPPADRVLHVSVRDRATMQVVGARVFEGDDLLYTSVQTERSMHAVAIDGNRATLSLTGLAKILVTSAALPSLRSISTVRFGGLGVIEAAPIFSLSDHRSLLDAPDRRRILASDLASSPATAPLSAAGDDCARQIAAWGAKVAICGGSNFDEPAPVRLAVRR